MTSFLFWNVLNRDLRALVARAAAERDVDILLLAESGVIDGDMVAALKKVTGRDYSALSYDTDKVRVFTRLPAASWVRRQTDALKRPNGDLERIRGEAAGDFARRRTLR